MRFSLPCSVSVLSHRFFPAWAIVAQNNKRNNPDNVPGNRNVNEGVKIQRTHQKSKPRVANCWSWSENLHFEKPPNERFQASLQRFYPIFSSFFCFLYLFYVIFSSLIIFKRFTIYDIRCSNDLYFWRPISRLSKVWPKKVDTMLWVGFFFNIIGHNVTGEKLPAA